MITEPVPTFSSLPWIQIFGLLILSCHFSCSDDQTDHHNISSNDTDLIIDLVEEDPDIATPIGMVFDDEDALYILESHTHTQGKDYDGPSFDRIKKWVDENGDGIPEKWLIFADSIEDGMNLSYHSEYGVFLSTKKSILLYADLDGDGQSDKRETIAEMIQPANIYDHAGILGVTNDGSDYLYFSRGNTGGAHWVVRGTDGKTVEGFGDGGSVIRCKMDGTEIEQIATGFWNPFDIKFAAGGRLFVTDNDPDSRGPNRLIEIVPGGDYGYKTLYGASGIHPYLSWNGELPGTLPFAAPLGEAPCALTDASLTNFRESEGAEVLVCVWEENNIVRIKLNAEGSSVVGKPEVLVQGDHLFHPVAMASNSNGDLYVSDWVLRQYPNHGMGKIWRIKSKNPEKKSSAVEIVNRFSTEGRGFDALVGALKNGDVFEQSMARKALAVNGVKDKLLPMLGDADPKIRLQILLTFFEMDPLIGPVELEALIKDEDHDVQRMTLIYIGEKRQRAMYPIVKRTLFEGDFPADLFETVLATIRHLQPDFIEAMTSQEGKSSQARRVLPEDFVKGLLIDDKISEKVKSMAIPYLDDFESNKELLGDLLLKAENEEYQITLIKAVAKSRNSDLVEMLRDIALNGNNGTMARSTALQYMSYDPKKYYDQVLPLLEENDEVIRYAVIKYIGKSDADDPVRGQLNKLMETLKMNLPVDLIEMWKTGQEGSEEELADSEWVKAVDGKGNEEIGRLVFEDRGSLCVSCHKVSSWGGAFGPALSKVGSSKSKTQLINAILDPSSEISPEWQGWYVIDKDGDRHIGRQIDVKEGLVELMNIEGEFDEYPAPQSYGPSESSVMPEGLEKMMTPMEFSHLISYLISLK